MLDITNLAHLFCVCTSLLLLMWLSFEAGARCGRNETTEAGWILGPLTIISLALIIGLIASLFMMVAERI
jgi:hypothetical protein